MLRSDVDVDMNLTELLDRTASQLPQKPALIEGSSVISYAGLVEKVNALADQLQAHGVRAGVRIGLCGANSIEYVALTFALWRVKAIVVPIPVECVEDELSEISASMQLDAILSRKTFSESVALQPDCLQPDCFFTRLKPTQ